MLGLPTALGEQLSNLVVGVRTGILRATAVALRRRRR